MAAESSRADQDASSSTRRAWLQTVTAASLAAIAPRAASAKADRVPAVVDYLARLARPDGGYAWEDQDESHLTPTFAVIGSFRLLGLDPPDKDRLAEFVRTHHPAVLKKLEQEHHEFEYQQIQALLWLGADASAFRAIVRRWTRPAHYLPQYEQHGWPILRFEAMAFVCRKLLGLPLDDLDAAFLAYLDARRHDNGSFNNTPAADGGDGHVTSTWWGLGALDALGRVEEKAAETVAWLRSCQLPCGGFTYQPGASIGGVDDVAYTRAAVRALARLGHEPADRAACVRYLGTLANADGGFGDRPGWASNPMATFYALDALSALRRWRPSPAHAGLRRPEASGCRRT